MSEYLVIHNYGTEGWKVMGTYSSVLDAVNAREADLANGGGESVIVEKLPLFDAYRQAGYEQDQAERARAKEQKA